MKRRIAFILLDGIGDVAYRHLPPIAGDVPTDPRGDDIRTPLQIARTPNIDSLCTGGVCGMMDSFEPGVACGSDTAHLSMFGYPPTEFYSGRGCFECMGAGLPLDPGDIGFKSNFSTMNFESGIVEKRRADRSFEREGPILCDFLDKIVVPGFEELEVRLKYATEHRCGIRIRGPNTSSRITGTDPLRDDMKLLVCEPTVGRDHPEYAAAARTSAYVNALSSLISEKLSTHVINFDRVSRGKRPANVILFRGAGTRLKVTPFHEWHGMKGFMIAPTCIIAGFGMNLGMDLIHVEGATGDVHTDFDAKGAAFVDTLLDVDLGYEFGFLHIKATDDVGHDGDVAQKVRLIEKSDAMIGYVLERLKSDLRQRKQESEKFVVAVTGDHSTPCSSLDHSNEPVPFVVAEIFFTDDDGEVHFGKSDDVHRLNEVECPRGYLGRFCGSQVFDIFKRF